MFSWIINKRLKMRFATLKKYFISVFSIATVLSIAIFVLSLLMIINQQALVASKDLRYQSYLLADELRQSSDDLTRLVRTYVVTGDPKYEQQFWQVLAIRNGEKPRPQNYQRIYWDLMAVGIQPYPGTRAIALHTLMQQAGFTESEFALLRQAQQKSDELIKMENIAMHAVKGLFQDEQGKFTVHGEPNLKMARELVHGEAYHQAKAAIMQPINQFFQQLDQRTATQANHYVNRSDLYLFLLGVFVFVLLIMKFLAYRGIHRLGESEKFLHLVIDNVPQLIFWKDTQSKYLGCNQAVVDVNQLATPEEIVGKTDFDLAWQEWAVKYRNDDRRVMTTGHPKLSFVQKIRRADGEVRWVEGNKIPLRDAMGKVIGILGTLQDITEKKQAEIMLAEYNQRLEAEVVAKTEEIQSQSEELAATNEELQAQSEEILATNEKLDKQNQLLQAQVTMRQQIETQLRASEERFALAMQGANDGIWDWQIDTNQVYFSPRWKEMLGYADHEIPDRLEEFSQRVHPEELNSVMYEINAYLKKRKPTYEVMVRMQHKAGHYIWIFTRGMAIWDNQGKAVRFVGTNVDLTVQKKVEAELRHTQQEISVINQQLASQNQLLQEEIIARQQIETQLRASEERFALAMQGANDGIWDWQIATNQLYLSPRWKEMLGYADDEIKNDFEEFTQRVHPEDLDLINSEISAYLERRKPNYEVSVRMQHKAGHYVWILARGIAIWDSQGNPIRFVGTNVDLTAQKKIEAELEQAKEELSVNNDILEAQTEQLFTANQELESKNHVLKQEMAARQEVEGKLRVSEQRFTLAMQGANDGIWDWQIATNQLYLSPRWKEMLGYADHEIPDRLEAFTQHVHPEDIEVINNEIKAYLRKRKPIYEVVMRMQHKAGHYLWILTRGKAVWDHMGNPIRFVGTHVDLTPQKQMEEELRQAKEAADAANRAKSAFLANMSHELRTPLNGILGYAQILGRDKSLTSKQKEGIAIIRRSGDYLLTLVNDILDLSKIEANKVELYPTDFHFQVFLQEIVDLFKMRAEQKGIAFIYIPLSHLPTGIRADEKRLRQVLINLLANAVKFTERGSVTLKVGYHEEKIRFQIEDTGVGIKQADLVAIFQPFQQSGEGVHRADGTGLGLTITKRIIEMMGGEISVTSTLDKGSTFWFAVALPDVSHLIATTKNIEEQPVIIGFHGAPKKILVVDDRVENRLVMLNLLTPLGFEVIEASNGEEGLQQAIATQPDIILADLVMPVLDGFEMIRQLRKMPAFATMPILAVSASIFDYHQEQSLEVGCDAFIPKPFQAEVLLAQLQKNLNLEWKYEAVPEENENRENTETQSVNTETIEKKLNLTTEQANTLYDLAMRGDISGIIAYADQLIEIDASLHHFSNQIKTLASQFNDDEICQLVEPYIK
jgi:PAS domain S-box-containing protein